MRQRNENRNNFITFWSDVIAVAAQEMRAIFSDSGVMIFFFLVPLIYPLMYASIYNKEIPMRAPLVVVDEDDSHLSREYVRRVGATQDVEVVAIVTSQVEAKQLMNEKKAYGCLIIPDNFSSQLAKKEQAHLALISELSSVFYYKSYMIATNYVALEMGRELTAEKHEAGSEKLTQIAVRPIRNEFEALVNPQGGYATFLLPSVLILILQQTMLLGVCMLVSTARERKTRSYLAPDTSYKTGLPLRVTIGRSLSYVSLYLVISIWTLIVVPYIFSLPILATPFDLLAFLVPFILAITFFSQSVALFVRGREDTIIYLVFSSVLFIFLMGISWPESALPPFWRALSNLFPCVPGAQAYVALNSFGATLGEVAAQYKLLWIQALGYLIFSSLGNKYLIRSFKGYGSGSYPASHRR